MDTFGLSYVILEGCEGQFPEFTLNNPFQRYDLNQPIL